eukprot:TRINITY_DN10268_c0_g1_i1.p1 TRINITY_DN10268_c0_g1~~TRINITY_DN10268_c0_g1_i1.p1  ORF type:complete len:146 (+),score=21.94 TRINITY_DN10268_c0_g1_i1:69-506(+)
MTEFLATVNSPPKKTQGQVVVSSDCYIDDKQAEIDTIKGILNGLRDISGGDPGVGGSVEVDAHLYSLMRQSNEMELAAVNWEIFSAQAAERSSESQKFIASRVQSLREAVDSLFAEQEQKDTIPLPAELPSATEFGFLKSLIKSK